MKPELMVLEMDNGSQIAAQVSIEAGYLKVAVGGFLGPLEFRLRPSSIVPICRRILALFKMKEEVADGPKDAEAWTETR